MDDLELIFTMLGEASTTRIAKAKDPRGMEENKIIARQGGEVAGNARRELESKTGVMRKSVEAGRHNYEQMQKHLSEAEEKTETSIIAAALETIERVGPSDTKISIDGIEDVRGSKRDYILERAKKLMERLGDTDAELSEITDEIKTSIKASRLQGYGTENLPSGDISGDELIIVEGRADVINLLKKGIKNVIGMNGTKLPETIKQLSKEKAEVILFVDGDRGGNLIIKNVLENAKIDFIAMAPEGKEVEELAGKEILQALRKKVPAEVYLRSERKTGVNRYDIEKKEDEGKIGRKIKKITPEEKEKIREDIEELIGTKGAVIFNDKLEKIKKIPVGRLMSIRLDETPYAIAIDGVANRRIISVCEELGCHNLIATNFIDTDTDVNLVSM